MVPIGRVSAPTLRRLILVAVIGAAWAALVHQQDSTHSHDAMGAPVSAPLEALQWVARGIALMLCIALTLALVSWRRIRRSVPD